MKFPGVGKIAAVIYLGILFSVTAQVATSSAAVKLTSDSASKSGSDICRDSTGNLHLVYNSGGNTINYRKMSASGVWSNEETVSAGNNAAIAVDGNGTVHLAYLNNSNLMYRTRSVAGVWSDAENLSWADHAPDIAAYGNGIYIIALCQNAVTDSALIFTNASGSSNPTYLFTGYRAYNPDGTYHNVNYSNPKVKFDASGNYYVAVEHWLDGSGNGMDIQVYRSQTADVLTLYSSGYPYPHLLNNAFEVQGTTIFAGYGGTDGLGGAWGLAQKVEFYGQTYFTHLPLPAGSSALSLSSGPAGSTYAAYIDASGNVAYAPVYVYAPLGAPAIVAPPSIGRNPVIATGPYNASIVYEVNEGPQPQPPNAPKWQLYYQKTGPGVSVAPASSDFGTVNVGSASYPHIFTVTNIGTENLVISSSSIDDSGDFSCPVTSNVTIIPNGSQNISATFAPASAGHKSANLIIASNDPDSPEFKIPLTGEGQSPYSVTVTKFISGGDGTVQVNGSLCNSFPCVNRFNLNGVAEIFAAPDSCSKFSYWGGDIGITNNPVTITGINRNYNILAFFDRTTFTLETSVNNPQVGSITPSVDGTYNCGSTVNITAAPLDSCHYFTGWSGDITGSTNPVAVTMNAHKKIEANFALKQFNLTTSSNNSGWGSVSTTPGAYGCGSAVSMTATPASACYEFTGWSGDASGTQNPLGVTMDSDKNIVANFAVKKYMLTAGVNDTTMGSVRNPVTGLAFPASSTYNCGTQVQVTATENDGYSFALWSGAVSGSVRPATVTMDANKSITANFKAKRYLSNSTQGSGSLTLNPNKTATSYLDGDVVAVTATPAEGWAFSHWTGNLSGSQNPASITMNADKSITAVFKLKRFLTLASSGTGTGTLTANPDKAQTGYLDGDSVTITASPFACSDFSGWSGNASGTGNPQTITMDSNKNILASFAIKRYHLTAGVNDPTYGSVTAASGDYNCGDTVPLSATANPGFIFSSWSGSVTGAVNPVNVTMDAGKTVTANFKKQGLLLSFNQKGASVSLTASVYYNDVPVVGKTIKFYEQTGTGSFVLKGSVTTNSSGLAAKTFNTTLGAHAAYAMFAASGGIPAMQSGNETYTVGKVMLVSPSNGGVVTASAPTLSWQPYSDAISYRVQMATASSFSASSLIVDQDTPDTSLTTPTLTAGKTYYWRVCASIPSGRTVNSDTWKTVSKTKANLKLEFVSLAGARATVRATLAKEDGSPIPGKSLTFYENSNGGVFASKGTAATGSAASASPGVATKSWTAASGEHHAYAAFKGDTVYAAATTDPEDVTYINAP